MRMCKSWQVLLLVSVTVRYFAALSIPWTRGSLRIAARFACRVGLHILAFLFVALSTAASKQNNSPDEKFSCEAATVAGGRTLLLFDERR